MSLRLSMLRTLPILLAVVLLAGCGEFNKAVKSTDKGYKMDMAVKYYDKKDFDRAMPLLEELRQITRGDTMFERVSYYYAKGYYGMKDYIMAGYYLDNFAKTFRSSRFAEECSFLAAICHYKESPEYELDQTDTRTAISQLELFMVRYPETGLKDSCNTLIDQLRAKLERKEYEGAKQYLHTRNYRAASQALQNFLRHWPNSKYREDALYGVVQADHQLVLNSVALLRPERSEQALKSLNALLDAFPEGTHAKAATTTRKSLEGEQERYLFDALQAAHQQALAIGLPEERLNMVQKGFHFFDTFALRFPQSRWKVSADEIHKDLNRMRATASTSP